MLPWLFTISDVPKHMCWPQWVSKAGSWLIPMPQTEEHSKSPPEPPGVNIYMDWLSLPCQSPAPSSQAAQQCRKSQSSSADSILHCAASNLTHYNSSYLREGLLFSRIFLSDVMGIDLSSNRTAENTQISLLLAPEEFPGLSRHTEGLQVPLQGTSRS